LTLGIASSAQVHSEPDADILTGCAAFAPDGNSAFAAVETEGISLEITSADGKVSHLRLALRYPVPASQSASLTISRRYWTCSVHFSYQSDVVALGVGSSFGRPELTHLQVGSPT